MSPQKHNLRLVVVCVLLIVAPVSADTILLMNGNEISGTIVDPNADPIVLEVPGGTLSFELTEIQEIDINDQGFQGKPKDASSQPPAASEQAVPTQIFADLPPPANDEERNKRYDILMNSLDVVTRSPEEATQEMLDREEEFIAALGRLGPAVAPQIEDTIRFGDVRQAAPMLEALQLAAPERAALVARDLIEHTHPEARAEAIKVLASSTSADRAQLLTKALDDPLPANRLEALAGIAATKDPNVALDAAKLLADPSPEVSQQVVATLQSLTGQSFATVAEWQQWAQANGLPANPGEPTAPVRDNTLNATTAR